MIGYEKSVITLCEQARVHLNSGELYAACNLMEQAADRLPEEIGETHAQVWYLQGIACAELGEVIRSMEVFLRFIAHRDRYPAMASLLLGPVHYHLAVSYQRRHEPLLALCHFRQAADLLRAEGYRDLVVRALHGAARLCCEDGNPAGAEPFLAEAEPLVRRPSDRAYQAAYRAYVLVLEGGLCQAMTLLEQTADGMDWDDQAAAGGLSMCQYVAGIACLHGGLTEAAVRFAAQADQLAVRAGDPLLMNLACSLRARAIEQMSAARVLV